LPGRFGSGRNPHGHDLQKNQPDKILTAHL
jgi:hypothetical protein